MRTFKVKPARFSISTFMGNHNLRRRARNLLALSIATALVNLSAAIAFGSPTIDSQTHSGLITVVGLVTINGSRAISGQTVFSGSSITTETRSESLLCLDNQARLKIDGETALTLEFSHSGLSGSLGDGGISGFVPAGIRAQIKTADALVDTIPAQPAAFTIQAGSCSTTLSVQTGQVEIQVWNSVKSVGAGESFSTAESIPPAPQQNLTKRKLVGLSIGIGAALGVLLFVVTGRHHQTQTPDGIGCVIAPSGTTPNTCP
jgi:ferric-dicitrate binding protein FerR (iron transport regulator)